MRRKYSSGVQTKMSKVLETLLRADPVKPKKWGEGKRRKRDENERTTLHS